jgi:hypothetical protein
MFIQHQQNIPGLSNSEYSVNNDFELVIVDKSSDLVRCTIYFEYLKEHFECAILLTPNSIQLNSLNPFKGIVTNAPLVTAANLQDQKYILNDGTITKNGNQNIVWLMHDVIHLFNLLRLPLKAKSLLAIYRELFVIAKDKEAALAFGKINISDALGIELAALFSAKLKLKHKYLFSDSCALLQSVQNLINQNREYFATPLTMVA